MSISLFAPSRTVIIISDDALFIYMTGAKGARFVESVSWGADNFEINVANILSKDCDGRPVVVLNDMVEQHYRKEKIPRVSIMDKKNVVQRKLTVAFSNYPVRAALLLKEKAPKADKTGAGGIYIFAAVPATDAFNKTMAALQRSLVPIAAFCLLPIESSDMVKKLSIKLSPKGEKPARWTIFMGQHQGGGLRQIVTKDGELALTRMTPLVMEEGNSEQWSTEVYQEFKATMSYLSRFGFESSEGLNVILVSSEAAGARVQDQIDVPCNFFSKTPSEVADLLGLSIAIDDDSIFVDILHVAWASKKSSFILPMRAREIDKVSKPRNVVVAISLLLFLSSAFLGYQFIDSSQKIATNWSSIKETEEKKARLDLEYQGEVKKKADLGFDIQLIQSSLIIKESFDKNKVDLLKLFYNIGVALGRDMRIDKIEVDTGKPELSGQILGGDAVKSQFVATMQMTFPSTTDAQKGNKEVQDLQMALQSLLKDHTVRVTKLLEDYEYSEQIVVEAGDTEKKPVSQDYVAEIRIGGPVQ